VDPVRRVSQAVERHGVSGTLRRLPARIGDLVTGKHPTKSPARVVFEEAILAHYRARPATNTILFVGCAWPTADYPDWFADREFWTIDPDPDARRFAAHRHVVDGLQNLAAHFPRDSFDLIVVNGVFGWGLDTREDCEAALGQCLTRLVPGGELVLGWNDSEPHRPFPLEELPVWAEFEELPFGPLGSSRYVSESDGPYVFRFMRKPLGAH
jgi:hypothetical protein